MTETSEAGRAALERELQYYKNEYNEIGARLLRLQEEQSRVSREARRSRIVARLVREAYGIAGRDIPAAAIGAPILALVADTAFCDRAVFLKQILPGHFIVEHALGPVTGTAVTLEAPPAFLFTAAGRDATPDGTALTALLGVPYVLWSFEPSSGRALALGNHTESNIHRPFEAKDQELVEVVLAVYIDVLLRKLAETTLREAKQAAETANHVRARFLAVLSHELRTPLNAIIGFAELLLQKGTRAPALEQRDEFGRQIRDAGRSLLALVKDILDFSSLSNAAPSLRLDWIPVSQLLHNAARAFTAETVARQVGIEIAACEPGLQARVDYDRFRQIMSNLLGNALKFTPPGGCIQISGRASATGGLDIAVCDNGIGMRPEDIPKALEPFVQLANDAYYRTPGTGLGLPIARQLTEAHHGALTIDSVPGQGTTVTLTFPATSLRRAADAGVTPPLAAAG